MSPASLSLACWRAESQCLRPTCGEQWVLGSSGNREGPDFDGTGVPAGRARLTEVVRGAQQ